MHEVFDEETAYGEMETLGILPDDTKKQRICRKTRQPHETKRQVIQQTARRDEEARHPANSTKKQRIHRSWTKRPADENAGHPADSSKTKHDES